MSERWQRRQLVLTISCIAVLSAACSSSKRSAADAQSVNDVRAVVAHHLESAENHCCVPGLRVVKTDVTIARVDGAWATARATIVDNEGAPVQSVGFLLHRVDTRWSIIDEGSILTSCGVPANVQDDLDISSPPPGETCIEDALPAAVKAIPSACVSYETRLDRTRSYGLVTPRYSSSKECARYAANGFYIVERQSEAWRVIYEGSVPPDCASGIPAELVGCDTGIGLRHD